MRGLPGRGGGAIPNRSGSRVALTALVLVLALVVAISLGLESRSLESGAANVLLPADSAPLTVGDAAAARTPAPAAQQSAQSDHYLRKDQDVAGASASAAHSAHSNPAAVASAPGAPSHAARAGLSRSQAVALVQRRYRARVVRAHVLQTSSGQRLYVLRLLSSTGMLYTVRLDPASGAEVP